MKLRITPFITNEWSVRAIGDVIPALESALASTPGTIEVSGEVAEQIAADCEFYVDPKAIDATGAERAGYRALLRQIRKQQGR